MLVAWTSCAVVLAMVLICTICCNQKFLGVSSDYYQEFRKHCYTAFLHLRRHANLILNLFSLMTDATVPDIALEPDKTVKKVSSEKFRLTEIFYAFFVLFTVKL